MSDEDLQRLVKIGQLKVEAYNENEFRGLVTSAKKRLADARKKELSPESRFDLAYNAAHGFALAALRHKGYRPQSRYLVFQTLGTTLGFEAAVIRVLAKCHGNRNLAEYEGHSDVDAQLLAELIDCANKLERAVGKLR